MKLTLSLGATPGLCHRTEKCVLQCQIDAARYGVEDFPHADCHPGKECWPKEGPR